MRRSAARSSRNSSQPRRKSSTARNVGGQRAAQRDQHEGREVGEGELGERGIGAPERGDQGEGDVGPRLTRVGHPPMIARPPWRTTSSSAACGCRVPRPEVFEFFADPRNLERVHPAWARPRWLAPPPARLAPGAVLDFRVAWLPGRWRVIIREFDAPYRFVDAQVRGPFARWEHRHRFAEGAEGEGGTWVEDRADLPAAAGPAGPPRARLRRRPSRARPLRLPRPPPARPARSAREWRAARGCHGSASSAGSARASCFWGEVRKGA